MLADHSSEASDALQTHAELRLAHIVMAALRLAREVSPALITTTDIGTAIGVTQGAVKHFASEDAIWLAAVTWVKEELSCALDVGASAHASPIDALGACSRTISDSC
ncbi:MAG: hypothetical protein ABIZ18_10795 [Caldimonas sp.]